MLWTLEESTLQSDEFFCHPSFTAVTTTSLPGFYPTRPLSRSVGRVGENPGNEVAVTTNTRPQRVFLRFKPALWWMKSATQPFLESSRNAPRCVTTLKTAV